MLDGRSEGNPLAGTDMLFGVVGMIIVSVIFLFTTVSTIIGLAGAQSTKTSVEKNSVLFINLSGIIEERTEEEGKKKR